jgi:hypothetical protein
MLATTSSRELSEYMAYDRLSPIGDERADLRSALIATVLANVNRDPKKQRAFKLDDFLLRFEEKPAQTADEMLRIAEVITAAFGGVDKRQPQIILTDAAPLVSTPAA